MITIRPETPLDFAELRALELNAFAPSRLEADIVDALRAADAHVPELCLVAVDEEDQATITGHVMLSIGHVDAYPALALGPIAVDPARQHQGIGTALMHAVIDRASRTDYPLIALLGHPAYYPRFGFRPAAATYGVTTSYDAPPEAWMALALPAYRTEVQGGFAYAEAFGG